MLDPLQSSAWQRAYQELVAQLPWLAPRVVFGGALRILLILAAFWILRRAAGRLMDAVLTSPTRRQAEGDSGQVARLRTLQSLLRSLVNYTLLFIAVVMVLEVVGLNIGALIAGAGVAGMAIGFGAQRLIRDVIAGFFILVEDQYSVGDRITVGAVTGDVLEIGMRVTRLRDEVGKLVILANGDISTVTNQSRGPLVASVDIQLPGKLALGDVQGALAGIVLEPGEGPLLAPPELRGIVAMDASTVTIRVAAPSRAGEQQEAEMLLRQKIHEMLRAADTAS